MITVYRSLRLLTVVLLFVCLGFAACSETSGVTNPPETEPPEETPLPSAVPDVLVSSRNTHSVKRFNGKTGEYIKDFIPPNSGGLGTTQEVAYGPDGHLYVSGRSNDFILRYDGTSGEFIDAFTSGYNLDQPTKMTFGPDGMLYVSQWGTGKNSVARFDAQTGVFVDEATPQLGQPMGHAWDGDGTLYVAVFNAANVRAFDAEGNTTGNFLRGGALGGPVNLWFDDAGDLLVVDWTDGTVKRYDGETGAFKSNYITGLTRAEGVAVGPEGALYICDWQDNRINKYDPETGRFLEVFTDEGGLQHPNSIIFMPSQDKE